MGSAPATLGSVHRAPEDPSLLPFPLLTSRAPWPLLAWTAILLLGLGLRALLWDAFPFREDEAIYSTWALHAWNGDPLFLAVWPDKPPLFLWILGGAFRLFGPGEGTARWLNILASTATIPVTALTAHRLWGRWAGWAAGWALALNPFAISFAPTAYTDPMLVLWGSLALHAAVTRRGFWAGLWLGAAIMTKQQGLLYAPLILGLLWAHRPLQEEPLAQRILPPLLGLALLTGPILLWDSLRWSVAPSPWDLSLRHYGPLLLLPPTQWLPRLQEWGQLAWHLTASGAVWGMLGAGIGAMGLGPWWMRGAKGQRRHTPPPAHETRHPGVRPPIPQSPNLPIPQSPISNLLLTAWSLAFLALHVVTSVQVWDRYLLPLAPMLALGIGWMVQELAPGLRERIGTAPLLLAGMAGLALLLGPAWTAAQGGLPVGGDHGDYAGLREAVAWLQTEAPEDAVLYHRVLGWHFRYYLFQRTGPDGMELRWFPSTVYLADNAAKTPHRRKFLIQPDWAPLRDASRRLAQRGLRWERRFRQGRFTVYELVTPPQPPCDWCFSSPQARVPASSPWPELALPPSAHPPLSEARHVPSTR